MTREPIVISEPLGESSPLLRAMLDGAAGAGWIASPPRTSVAWKRRAADVAARFAGRGWLEELRPALAPAGEAAGRLERVASEGGVLVTTGQQPGLFGGPIYTWSKALSALALADAIQESTGVPTAPVFWAATDDSDYAEASTTLVAVPGGFEAIRLPGPPPADDRMLSALPLPEAAPLVAALQRGAGSVVHADVLELARRSHAAGTTIGDAYVTLLRAILGPLGIAVLDASHEAVARAMRPLLAEALMRARRIAAAVEERDAGIADRGFEPQVRAVPGLSLVFRRDGASRSRVPLDSAIEVARGDHELGPNVLLRPVAESVMLPTVAYAGGPGELAYFAQVGAVADALDLPTPVAVPRWSGTILEPHVVRILERHGLSADALRDPHSAEAALARAALPESVSEALAAFREDVETLASRLRGAETGKGDARLLPEQVTEGHRRSLLHRLERLERRALAAVKRRQAAAGRDLATARGALYPAGRRQERALNLLPLLARHGPVLLDRMRERAREHADALVEGGRALVSAR